MLFKGKGSRTYEQTPARGSEHIGHFCQEWSFYHQAQILNHQTSFRHSAVHQTPNALTHQYFASLTLGTQAVAIRNKPSTVLAHHWLGEDKTRQRLCGRTTKSAKLDARPLQPARSRIQTTRKGVLSRKYVYLCR
jgi:hypothetical protein